MGDEQKPEVNVRDILAEQLQEFPYWATTRGTAHKNAANLLAILAREGVTLFPTADYQALVEALGASAATFKVYAANHRVKGTPEGDAKAAANDDAAAVCEAALAKVEKP